MKQSKRQRNILIIVGLCAASFVILFTIKQQPVWENEPNLRPVINRTIVISHFDEDVSYLDQVPPEAYNIYVYTHQQKAVSIINNNRINIRYIENKGFEAFAYISYIIDNYYTLPDKVLFMHAQPMSKHQRWNILQIMQRVVWEQPTELCSVNEVPESIRDYVNIYDIHVQNAVHLWNSVFASTYGPLPPYLEIYCCAQFVLSRNAIHYYPLHQWERMRNYLLLDFTYSEKKKAIGFEILWKYILTHTVLIDREKDRCWFALN